MQKDKIHLKSPGNWINDPNGFIYYRGKYHLFYQYFPWAPQWGTMHWGHAVSKDLVNWEHQEIALFPTKYEDQNGCFSGSALEYRGRLYLYYTGVHYHQPDPDNIHLCRNEQFLSSQMLITSRDGMRFDNFHNKSVIIPCMEENGPGDRTHTRDPKVWRGSDAWYMVLGSTDGDGLGKLLFYRSTDLTDWKFVNAVSGKNGFGWMWECPDYFETEGGGVLLLSPMEIMKDGKKDTAQTICMPVEFEETTCTMQIPNTYQFVDYGLDLYAAQTTLDEEGRRTMVAWMRMPQPVDGAWSGMFCIPRVVELRKGHVYFRVHPNIEKMYTKQILYVSEADRAGYKISVDIGDGESIGIGGYWIFRRGCHICTDRSNVFGRHTDYRLQFMTPEIKEGYHLDIYVDHHLIEIFINDGEYVLSNVVYGLDNRIQTDIEAGYRMYTLES
ncbi:MAG: glycoside hydrolase family 32 protein [Lachnospiraceae bacterium]|jgi:beta-fructofuranosidase|nr:glycoside hydrolase family 32 protein [Lachnospiraceae bacterium]